MPAFSKIAGILREHLTHDQAAVHAAEAAVYEALEQKNRDRVMLTLGNPALGLEDLIIKEHAAYYYEALQTAREGKLSHLDSIGRSVSEIDAYDYILSCEELGEILLATNEEREVEHMARQRLEIVDKIHKVLLLNSPTAEELLLALLICQESGFVGVTAEYSMWYYDVIYRARTEKQSNLFWEEIRDLILIANSVGITSKSTESALLKIDRALDLGSHSSLLLALRSEELSLHDVDPTNIEQYFDILSALRTDKRAHTGHCKEILTEEDIQESVTSANQMIGLDALHSLAIQNINNSLLSDDVDLTLSYLEDEHSRISDVNTEYGNEYKSSLSNLFRSKSGQFMSRDEIQYTVDSVNSEMSVLVRIREFLSGGNEDSETFLSLLKELFHKNTEALVQNNIPHYYDIIKRAFHQSESSILSAVDMLEIVIDANESADLSVELSRALIEFNTYLETARDPAETLEQILNPHLSFRNISDACARQYHKELTRLRNRNIAGDRAPSQPDLWLECESIDIFPFYYKKQTDTYSWRQPIRSEGGSDVIDSSYLSNRTVQSVISSITSLNDRELYFLQNEESIVRIQSYLKMILGRRRFLSTLAHYGARIPDIVKVQSVVRCRLAMKSYQLIMTASDPPVSSVRKYLLLLEQSDRDVQEELELTSLKSELVTKIRYNKQLEEDLDSWDTKIGLLVRNRLNVMEVVHSTSKMERRRLAARSQSNKGLQYFTKENKQMLSGYEHLFYLLQTNSDYFAKLIFEMPSGKTTAFMQDVILTVFNYASTNREHFLLLQLFETALQKEIFSKVDRIDDIITGNPTVIKLIISFTRRMDYQQHNLKAILGPLIRKVLNSDDRISLNPVDIYKGWLSQTEIETGEPTRLPYEVSIVQALDHQEVRTRLFEAMTTVRNAADEFMEAIFSNVNNLPYGLRYMASKLRRFLKEKFPSADEEEIGKVIGNLIYYRFLNPVIAAPDAFEVVDLEAGESLENEHRKKLGSIARILQHAAAKKLFEGEYNCLDELNPYIVESYGRFMQYFSTAASVPSAEEKFGITEYSDLVMLSRPVINISAREIISTHKLLLAHLSAVTEENDPLREVLRELGDTPDIRDLLGDIEDRNIPAEEAQERWVEMGRQEIMLTLINRFETIPKDNLSLDTNAKFLETKGMIVDLLKVHPGETLPEIITAVHSPDTEVRFDRLMEKTGNESGSETNLVQTSLNSHHAKACSLSELKFLVRENLEFLEEQGVVKESDGYQLVLNAIARDIRNQHRYRRERKSEKARLNDAISQLNRKHRFLEEQFEYYQQYVKTATANMSKGGNKQLPLLVDVPRDPSPVEGGETFKRKSVRYSAQKLFDKGILIEIEGVSRSQFKTLFFEIVSVTHGSFDINAKMLGLAAEKVNIVFEDLLQLRFENVQIMKILDRVKVNVNLLIYLLNKKFYGR